MRVNIYSQEITADVETVSQEADTGVTYSAVRLFLHSSDRLHHRPGDDDRSAITFWLPKSRVRRKELAETFMRLAEMTITAPPETGLD